MRLMHLSRNVIAVCALLALAACGGKSPTGSGSSSAQEGGSTPQDVVARLAKAMEKDDFSAVLPLVLPEQRAALAFGLGVIPMSFMMGMAEAMLPAASAVGEEEAAKAKQKIEEMKAAQEALLKKHGIEEPDESAMMGAGADKDAMMKMSNELMAGVDLGAFLTEAMALLEKFSDENSKSSTPFDNLDLEKVAIQEDGDKAVATMEGEEDPLHFVKVDGRWFADLLAGK